MAKVILSMQYEIDEKKRNEFLSTAQQLRVHYASNPNISYIVCEQKGKKSAFTEMYIVASEEAYTQFKESEDQEADALSEKLSAFMKGGKAKYVTYREVL